MYAHLRNPESGPRIEPLQLIKVRADTVDRSLPLSIEKRAIGGKPRLLRAGLQKSTAYGGQPAFTPFNHILIFC